MGRYDEQLFEDFARDGFVSLPDFLAPGELAELLDHTRLFLAETLPGMPSELVYYEERGRAASLKQVQLLQRHDPYFDGQMSGSRFERLAEVLLGEPVVGKNLQYFNKPAGSDQPTPPHQDGAFFKLEPCRALTMWLALEDVTEQQGCLRYRRGSHRGELLPHEPSGVLGFSQRLAQPCDGADELSLPCRAGHLLVHDAMTVHSAGGNRSADRGREALGWIYYAESAREDSDAHAAYQRELAQRLERGGRI